MQMSDIFNCLPDTLFETVSLNKTAAEILHMKTNGNIYTKKKKIVKYLIYKYLTIFLVPSSDYVPKRN